MEVLIPVVSGLCLFLGSFLVLTGGIGILRFPDFYTRMHAAGITDTLATGLILVGLMLLAGWSLVLPKLAMILLFVLFASPTASHALAKAAQHSKLPPQLAKPDKEGQH